MTGVGIEESLSDGSARVPLSVTAKDAKLPLYVVAYVAGLPASLERLGTTEISLRQHDHILALCADSARRKRVAAEAKTHREASLEEKRREQSAKEAAQQEISALLGLAKFTEALTTTQCAKALQISTSSVRAAIERGDLPGHKVHGSIGYGPQTFWRVATVDAAEIAARAPVPAWLQRARGAWKRSAAKKRLDEAAERAAAQRELAEHEQERRRAAKQQRAVEEAEARRAVHPSVALRRIAPERVLFHLGPTNSGKTHDALDAISEAGHGTYAAPLRMLAGEAFEWLTARLGEERVGLVTGEERINDEAPIIACTAEMAPMKGELLVLDEVHWANDPERGWAWTRLLLGGEYRDIHIVGAPDALPLVQAAFPEAVVVPHERLCPLTFEKKAVKLDKLPERSAVVVFSRKAVYHVAGLLKKRGRHPAVLYGAMPPGARRSEVARFISGEADVVVATDVIGHGINLPVAGVYFAETQKFDGTSRRDLSPWEVAQIGGRAGRFGFETSGTVGVLTGIAGMSGSERVVARGEIPDVDLGNGVFGHRKVTHGRLAPVLADLAVNDAAQLPSRLMAWAQAAGAVARDVGWVRVASVEDLIERLTVVENAVGLGVLDVESAWRLARSPLDPSDPVDAKMLGVFAHAIVGNADLRSYIATKPFGTLETLEAVGRQTAGLRWFTLAFPGSGGITHDEVVAHEDAVTRAIIGQLETAIGRGVATCTSCGTTCAPWSHWCDTCYRNQQSYRSWDYGDYDDYDEGGSWYGSPAPKRKPRGNKALRAERDQAIAAIAQDNRELERPQGVPRYIWLPLLKRLVSEVDTEQRSEVAKRLREATKRRVPGGFPRGRFSRGYMG